MVYPNLCLIIWIIHKKKNKKTPKIQRLITPNSIQKKRFNIKSKKERILSSKNNLKEFGKLLYRKI